MMDFEDLKNKKIGIVGYGLEGAAVARFLAANKIDFIVFDKDPAIEVPGNAVLIAGDDYLSAIDQCDLLFRSPGVNLNLPELQKFIASGKEITSQIKFFFKHCRAKIIGVTGTKGKGTTSKLLYEIMRAAGKKVYLGGNIGKEVLGLLADLSPEHYVVLELSSFQLQDLQQSPHIAVVLMTEADHLIYHGSEAEYVHAKTAITRFQNEQDFAVVNADYPNSMEIGKLGAAKKYYVHTFAAGRPVQKEFEGIFGSEAEHKIYFVLNGITKELGDYSQLPLRGFHNIQNVCAAAEAAKILAIDNKTIWEAAKKYKGLEHRLEFVAEKKGIKFYNDSMATTPTSTLFAIESFAEPEIVILGGYDKGNVYEQLAEKIVMRQNIKALILIGDVAPKIKTALHQAKFDKKIFEGAADMDAVFGQIKEVAQKGDVVLLAPATSSFGIFKDYKDRGNQFKKHVAEYE